MTALPYLLVAFGVLALVGIIVFQALVLRSRDADVRALTSAHRFNESLLGYYEDKVSSLRSELDRESSVREFYQEAAANSADLAATLRRRLDIAIDAHAELERQFESAISGSWSRDDHSAGEVDYCSCVDGVRTCNACVPF